MTKSYQEQRVPRRSTLPIRDLQYSVLEWGDSASPTFFYLHGWGDAAATFQFVVDKLASDWHVVAPDWRGFGCTEHTASSYWFPDYIADLHSIIDHYSKDTPARLVGHSMGGNVATLYAGSMPERVAAFVNLEGFGLPDGDAADAPLQYRKWVLESAVGAEYSTYENYEVLAKKIQRRSPAMLFAQAIFVARRWARRDDDGRVRILADTKHKHPNPVMYRQAEAASCAAAIIAPTLLVSGANSPYRLGARVAPPVVPNHGEAVVVQSVGHMLHFEAPGALAAIIEDFLSKTL